MTVEERARACAAEMGAGDIWERAIEAIEKHLRDQIEDCAKIVAGEASLCSRGDETGYIKGGYVGLHDAWLRIRALAAPKEEAPDGPDDRFDLGGFECNEKPID